MDSYTIIKNALVITCDAYNRAGRFDLLLRGPTITDLTDKPDLFDPLHSNARIIDASHKLIIPGFVNSHFHIESLLLRQRTNGVHFSSWKHDLRIREARRKLCDPANADDVRTLTLAAYFSHLKSGTTCVGEFGLPWNDKTFVGFLQAIERTEVRSVVALQNWDQIRQAKDFGSRRPKFLMHLGREEDFTVYSFDNLVREAGSLDIPLLAHLCEVREDLDVVKRNFQKSPLHVLHEFGALTGETLFAHLNYSTPQDIDLLEESGARVVLTPRSTARKQTGYPSLRNLLSRKVISVLGSDWGSTDMLRELQFLDQLSLMTGFSTGHNSLGLIRMATIEGARALGMGSEIGSVEIGKRADLTFFDMNDIRLSSMASHAEANQIASLVVRELTMANISEVMIDGEFYVVDGKMMTLDEADVVGGFRELCGRYFPASPGRPLHAEEDTQRQKVLPLLTENRKGSPLPTGSFEDGFPLPEQPFSDPLFHSATNPNPETGNPELPKDVRRVFGEDDDT